MVQFTPSSVSLTFEITNKSCEGEAYTNLDPTIYESLINEIDPFLADLRGPIISKLLLLMSQDTVKDVTNRRTFVSDEKNSKFSADDLYGRFGIGPEHDKSTLKVTT